MPLPRSDIAAVSPIPQQDYVDPLPHKIVSSDLEEPVKAIVQFHQHLTTGQRELLLDVLHEDAQEGDEPVEYGAGFDLAGEVRQQIIAVRAIREKVVGRDGRVKDGVASRDLNAVVSSGSTLITSLLKHHNQIDAMKRIRTLEKAVITGLQEVSPEFKDKVLQIFEEKLATL